MTAVVCGLWSSGLVLSEDVGGCAAAHVVAVVASTMVVVDEPGVGLGAELADGRERAAVEGGAPALVEDRAVESLDHGVVVRRRRRRLEVADLAGDERFGEPGGFPLGSAVGEHGSTWAPWRHIQRTTLSTNLVPRMLLGAPAMIQTIAQRVAVSTAVSW